MKYQCFQCLRVVPEGEQHRTGIECKLVDPVADNVASFARAGVIARIKHVLVVVSGRPLDVMSDSTRLHEDLELDSLERIEAGQALEEEFGIALSDDEVDQACMGTIGGIADYLMTQRGVA
jgi:acyl carrier protein